MSDDGSKDIAAVLAQMQASVESLREQDQARREQFSTIVAEISETGRGVKDGLDQVLVELGRVWTEEGRLRIDVMGRLDRQQDAATALRVDLTALRVDLLDRMERFGNRLTDVRNDISP